MLTVNNTTSAVQQINSPWSFSHTSNGSDRFLVVSVTTIGTNVETLQSVSYGGTNLTYKQKGTLSISPYGTVYYYYMFNPPSGSNTLTITPNAFINMSFHVTAISFENANQKKQLTTYDLADSGAYPNGTAALTSTLTTPRAGCYVIGTTAQLNQAASTSNFTPSAGTVALGSGLTGVNYNMSQVFISETLIANPEETSLEVASAYGTNRIFLTFPVLPVEGDTGPFPCSIY